MQWGRPTGGREPAAAALLGWLADLQAPGLCLVSGSEGSGKSGLLAWLAHHGSVRTTRAERAVHAVVPGSGTSLLGTVWSVADQLGVVARAPGELLSQLRRDPRRTVIVLPDLHEAEVARFVLELSDLDHVRLVVESRSGSPAHRLLAASRCAELNLDLGQWRDQGRFEEWQAALQEGQRAAPTAPTGQEVVDLSDPTAVCAADPWQVTVGYAGESGQDHGGLRSAWLRAGQSLNREQSPASRALTLLAFLGDGADPRLAPVLAELAAAAEGAVRWSRVRGDRHPPWPGPVSALALGRGPWAGRLLTAGPDGTVRSLHLADAAPHGRFRTSVQPVAMTVLADGTVLLIDGTGQVRAETARVDRPTGSGIAALLDDGPTALRQLAAAVTGRLGTALSSTAGSAADVVVLGDITGTVQTFGRIAHSAALHEGPVNALAALDIGADDEAPVSLVYSGGADGTVRLWAPGNEPMGVPLLERTCPVVALAAVTTDNGPVTSVAWDDGAVDWVEWNSGAQRTFRPGPPVRAVALTADGHVVIGMDEALVCVVPRRNGPHG
ncbi:hypothetical protein ABZ348_26695 [Streptomyces sp. NPDC005963]|uniref:hypothetical protein n=1 Tax=Streptomyces sp. NPDC005963 TaxID=3156721 RepID=UPI0033EEDA4A